MPVAWLVLFLSNVVVGDGQEAWQMLLRTVPSRGTSRLGQYWQKSFVDVFNTNCSISRKAIPFLSFYNILFLDGFNSSPGWLLVTRTRGASWCRYRGHCRSGPRHLSPRSRVCAQEWHCKDIHSHIHSHTPMHTPKRNRTNNNSKMLNSPNMMPSFTRPLPVQCAGGRLSGCLAPAPLPRPSRLRQL